MVRVVLALIVASAQSARLGLIVTVVDRAWLSLPADLVRLV